MKKQCLQCNGTGTITNMEPKKWGSSKNYVLLHNHLIPINHTCAACSGTGKVKNHPAKAA